MLQKLQQFLDDHGVRYFPFRHATAITAQKVAAAEHVPGREHAKVTIVRAGERLVMAVLPAPRRVDFRKLERLLPDTDLRLSDEEEFRSAFPHCEPGAMPPFGNLFGMEVFVDRTLAEDEQIVFEAGTHDESVRMRFADFVRLAKPRIVDFAR